MAGDAFQHTIDTGEWWTERWWLEDVWSRQLTIPRGRVDEAFSYLQGIFDAQWTKGLLQELHEGGEHSRNIVLRYLVIGGRGLPTIEFAVGLADALRATENAAGFKTLLNDLKQRRSASAYMELSIGALFAKRGMPVSFPKARSSKGRQPDVLVEATDRSFAVECKLWEEDLWEQHAEQLSLKVAMGLNNLPNPRGLAVRIEYHPRVTDLFMGEDKYQAYALALFERIPPLVLATARYALESSAVGEPVDATGIATITVLPKGHEAAGIVAPGAYPISRVRGLLKRCLDAAGQLPDERGGLVVVKAASMDVEFKTPALGFAFEAACAGLPLFSRVSGLLIIPQSTWFYRSRATLLYNPQATHSLAGTRVANLLAEIYEFDSA